MKSQSNKRYTKRPYRAKGQCGWCGTTNIPKGRRSWCSQKCVDAYLMRSSSQHIRNAVHKRDKGICAMCGIDADKEFKRWRLEYWEVRRLARTLAYAAPLDKVWKDGKWTFGDTRSPSAKEVSDYVATLLEKYAPGNWTASRQSGWDADHITPVVEGGGECDLDNLRTLCHPCHKVSTAELAGRRAAKSNKQSIMRLKGGEG